MNPTTFCDLLVLAGMIGFALWVVGIADHLYRLNLPRTRRSITYDRIANVIIVLGTVFVMIFVGGLYSLIA